MTMDQVLVSAALLGLLLVTGLLAVVPMRLPWPQQVRWTVLSQTTGYIGAGPMMCLPFDLREVTLVAVGTEADKLAMEVRETGHASCDNLIVIGSVPPTGDHVTMLHEWCELRTPMLLYLDPSGGASLHGPVAGATDLRTVGFHAQSS